MVIKIYLWSLWFYQFCIMHRQKITGSERHIHTNIQSWAQGARFVFKQLTSQCNFLATIALVHTVYLWPVTLNLPWINACDLKEATALCRPLLLQPFLLPPQPCFVISPSSRKIFKNQSNKHKSKPTNKQNSGNNPPAPASKKEKEKVYFWYLK